MTCDELESIQYNSKGSRYDYEGWNRETKPKKSHYGKALSCRVSRALCKALFTLGKVHLVNTGLAKRCLPSVFCRALSKAFAECQSDSWQKKKGGDGGRERWRQLCRVAWSLHSEKMDPFAECHGHCTDLPTPVFIALSLQPRSQAVHIYQITSKVIHKYDNKDHWHSTNRAFWRVRYVCRVLPE